MTERPALNNQTNSILTFVRIYIDKHGWAPTVREIGDAVGIQSTSTVQGQLRKLEMQGYIRRGEHIPRAIQVIP